MECATIGHVKWSLIMVNLGLPYSVLLDSMRIFFPHHEFGWRHFPFTKTSFVMFIMGRDCAFVIAFN